MGKIKISPLDNVEVNVGGEFDGHKTANRDIKEGEDIIKIRLSYRTCNTRYKKGRACSYR